MTAETLKRFGPCAIHRASWHDLASNCIRRLIADAEAKAMQGIVVDDAVTVPEQLELRAS